MLITLSRRTAICQSVAEVQLTGVVPLGAVSHRFNLIFFLVGKITSQTTQASMNDTCLDLKEISVNKRTWIDSTLQAGQALLESPCDCGILSLGYIRMKISSLLVRTNVGYIYYFCLTWL